MYRKITTTIITLLLFSIMLVPVTNASTLNKTVEGMLGFAPPEGTTALASSEYTPQYSAHKSIDQNKESYWNAGTYTGSIELRFPNPTEFNFVHITTNAEPVRTVSYIIYGLKNGEWMKISEEVNQSLKDTFTTSPPIKVKQGAYEAIKIEGNGGSSWLAISEITLGTFELINLVGEPKDSSAKLNWNSIKEATEYKIQYGTESGKYGESILVNVNSKDNYVVPNLNNGSTYYFQIVAVFNGGETVISNEAVVTLPGKNEPIEPPVHSSTRAILVVVMTTGLEKEFDLSMKEVNDFIDWYEAKQAGSGRASYAIDKHDNNKGPFKSRKDYILFDRVLMFEVSEY